MRRVAIKTTRSSLQGFQGQTLFRPRAPFGRGFFPLGSFLFADSVFPIDSQLDSAAVVRTPAALLLTG